MELILLLEAEEIMKLCKFLKKGTISFLTIGNDMKNKRNLRQKSKEFVECPPLSSNLRRFRTQGKNKAI